MDFLKKLAGDDKPENAAESEDASKKSEQPSSGGGILDKVNNALGGGAKGEKEEGTPTSLLPRFDLF